MRHLFILLTLVGCGAESASNEGANLTNAVAENRDVGDEDQRDEHALLISDTSKLPACDATAEGRLVYVKADSTFMTCTNAAWETVVIQGEKGEAGVAGEKGDDGVALPNTWLDPIGGKTWLVGGTVASATTAATVCVGDWRMPITAEVEAVRNHGIYATIGSWLVGASQHCAWVSDDGQGGSKRWPIKPGVSGTDCANMAAPLGVYCVKD
jgi:hypothetical protein